MKFGGGGVGGGRGYIEESPPSICPFTYWQSTSWASSLKVVSFLQSHQLFTFSSQCFWWFVKVVDSLVLMDCYVWEVGETVYAYIALYSLGIVTVLGCTWCNYLLFLIFRHFRARWRSAEVVGSPVCCPDVDWLESWAHSGRLYWCWWFSPACSTMFVTDTK